MILVTTWTVLHLAVTESSGSSSGSPYTLGHMEEVLVGVEDWGRGIRMGKWNQSIIPVGRVHPYNEHWGRKSNLQIILTNILKPFHHKFILVKECILIVGLLEHTKLSKCISNHCHWYKYFDFLP